jgi:hypothetical protein
MEPSPSAPPLNSLIHYPDLAVSSSSSSPVFPEYPDAHVGFFFEELPQQPVHINRFSNPLRPETIAHVERCSRGSALIGALLGGCTTYLYVQNSNLSLCSNLPLWKEMGFTVAGAFSSGALAYVAAQWFTTRRTAEKQDEAAINEIIDLNNAAFAAKCTLNADERSNLNFLLNWQNKNEPKNRVMVYDYALSLHQPKQARTYPIEGAVEYLDGTADAIKREGEALGNMKTERPSLNTTLTKDKEDELKQILKNAQSTYQAIYGLNRILPAQKITNWTSAAKELPEYTYQTAQEALREKHKDLKRREQTIKQDLAYLAWLHKDSWAEFNLDSFQSFLIHRIFYNYPNTPAGNQARQDAIIATGRNINKSVTDYLVVCGNYADMVIEHNKQVHQIPDDIKNFVESHRNSSKSYGSTNEQDSYKKDSTILAWNNHINLNDSQYLKTWFEQNFCNRPR